MTTQPNKRMRRANFLRQLIFLTFIGDIMLVSDILMEFLPNIHILAMLVIVTTRVYRSKALISIYIYAFLNGLVAGFGLWWIPYLYVWTILWAVIMLLPKKLPKSVEIALFVLIAGLHGLLFGVMYAPFQALAYGLSFKQMLVWIAAGLPFDITHMIGNVIFSFFAPTLIALLEKLERKTAI